MGENGMSDNMFSIAPQAMDGGVDNLIGAATAYADAVKAGYAGTREQWAEDMAKLGENLAAVRTEREKAEDAAQTAVDARDTAVQTINTARDNAVADVDAAADKRIEEIEQAGGGTGTDVGAVRFDAAQELTEVQQTTARNNINAGGAIVETAQGDGVVTVDDSAEAALSGLRIFGRSEQLKITGINLWKPYPTSTKYGVTLTANSDGGYTLNGTASSDDNFDLTISLEAGDYTLWTIYEGMLPNTSVFMQVYSNSQNSGLHILNTTLSGSPSSGTLRAANDYIIRIHIVKDFTYNNVVLYPMLVKGTYTSDTLPPFEPYTNGVASPSPDYPTPINSVGDDGEINISITESAQTLAVPTPNGLPGVPVDSGGNYTDADGQQWICDEVDFGRGVYVQRISGLVLKGDESWTLQESGTYTSRYRLDKRSDGIGNDNKAAVISSHHRALTSASRDEVGILQASNRGEGAINIRMPVDVCATAVEFKQWLAEQDNSGNPVTIKYALGYPTETPLTEEQLTAYRALRTQYPTTNVTNDEGAGMEISYVADTKTYIDNKFAELSAAILKA